jgi:transcriptional regulator with XRE-family HTH domain
MPIQFGHWLRQLRKERGLMVKELAQKAEVNAGHVSKLE